MKQNRYQFSESLDLDGIHSECSLMCAEFDGESFIQKFKFEGFEIAKVSRHHG